MNIFRREKLVFARANMIIGQEKLEALMEEMRLTMETMKGKYIAPAELAELMQEFDVTTDAYVNARRAIDQLTTLIDKE